MTTSDKSGPIAPRRPLAKQSGGPPRSDQRGSAGPATGTASDEESSSVEPTPAPASQQSPTSQQPNSSKSKTPAKPSFGSNGTTRSLGTAAPAANPVTASPGMASQVAAPRPAPSESSSASASREPSYPMYEPRSALGVETQPAIPIPPGLAPVPPAPLAPTVDKRAERAAAKAKRKFEASKPRTIRRAKLRIVRLDPWSVTKTAFLLSIAFGVMCVVAVFLIFSIMSASGLWDSVNTTIQGVVDQRPSEAFDIKDYVGMSRVMGITMLVAAIDVVIITALATLGAFIYNMSASLLGGVEVTLAEDLH
jgi:hypothetical protein